MITQKVLDQFTSLTKRAFSQQISDQIKTILNSALKSEDQPADGPNISQTGLVVTTEEEIEAFQIVKAIVRKKVPLTRVFMRDAQSYCAILLDDNNRKPICRFYFGPKKKQIEIPVGIKQFSKHEISSLDDIYGLSDNILKALNLSAKETA